MGIYVSSYAVRIEDLEKAIGSNDNHLYEEVSKVFDGDFGVKVNMALKDLIFNQPLHNHSADFYQYALEALCSYLGEGLHYRCDLKVGVTTDIVDNIFKSDFGLNVDIVETLISPQREQEFFSRLPISHDQCVCSGILDRSNLLSLQSQFTKIRITDSLLETLEASLNEEERNGTICSETSDKAEGYSLIADIKAHISYCVKSGFDLASFAY
ncbi:hypothetical protein BIY23_01170 [Wolbachia pipientis]|uniref:DUF7691 domain-containing protein n=1 Tax=Wolbachia pipientis TaxID=955 RepID=A0A1E7QKS8_WOLPI|nr:hypothetical protein [Wolbachia pipientis]OEY87081.1 hypothetical protein BIY23_01170 [Wolbachia pipientis]